MRQPATGEAPGLDWPPSIYRSVEISAESSEGFQDAIDQGLQTASRTVNNIKNAWVKDQEVVVSNNKAAGYRVHLKVTFVLE